MFTAKGFVILMLLSSFVGGSSLVCHARTNVSTRDEKSDSEGRTSDGTAKENEKAYDYKKDRNSKRSILPNKEVSDLSPPDSHPLFLADRYKRRTGPGPDHGDDPHDEQHDGDLPANKDKGKVHGSGDPYNGSTSNDRDHPFTPY